MIEKELLDKKVNDQLSYTIRLEKPGYLTKVVTFNYTIAQMGRINVHETLDLTMDKIDLGLDLASIIDINPIYFEDKICLKLSINPGLYLFFLLLLALLIAAVEDAL